MQRQTQPGAGSHERIAGGQLIDILCEQRPLSDIQKGSRLFQVSQHGREYHDGQTDPEEDEEAGEVGIFAGRVEVGDARLVFDGREDPPVVLVADLFADCGGGLDRGRSIFRGSWGASATAEGSVGVGEVRLWNEYLAKFEAESCITTSLLKARATAAFAGFLARGWWMSTSGK